MFGHYLKSTARVLNRQKGRVALSVVGLSVGLTCCLLITLWILDEWGYDRFHEGADRIHMVLVQGAIKNNPSTPIPLARALEEQVPEVVVATRYESLGEVLLSRGETRLYQSPVRAVDPAFFEIFSFRLLAGDRRTLLATPESIVISQSVARRFFGNDNPIGETLTYNNERDVIVTGILADLPDNSTLRFEVVVPFAVRISDALARGYELSWGTFSPLTFVRLCEACSPEEVSRKIEGFLQQQAPEEHATLSLLPLRQVHGFFTDSGTYVWILSLIAFFVLAIACINHVNLATARSTARAREIGVRKVVGGSRADLAIQFLFESSLLTFISAIVSLALVELLLPVFNEITAKEISLDFVRYPALLPVLIALLALTAAASGAYPAFIVSAFPPVESLRGRLRTGGNVFLRRSLIVVQFSLSVFLIVGTFVVYKQLVFLRNMDLGYARDHLITVSLKGTTRLQYPVLKELLSRNPDIESVSGMANDLPYFGWSTGTADWPGRDPEQNLLVYFNHVGYDFTETTGIRFVEGRDFSPDRAGDRTSGVLINEKMARIMGLDSALGATLTLWDKPREVLGVVEDFHYQPLQNEIGPLALLLDLDEVNDVIVRVRAGAEQSGVEAIQRTFESVAPMFPPVYSFVDDDLLRSYDDLRRMGILASGFTLLAILIACLGVVGISSYAAERRTKEIGVRKVLGASVARIAWLMFKELMLLVAIASVVAWPAAFLVMSRLLEAYAYRVNIGWVPFALAGILALVATVLTALPLAIRAATRNPTEVLRYE